MKVVNGEVFHETAMPEGKMMFHGAGTEWIWQGKQGIGGDTVIHELRKSK